MAWENEAQHEPLSPSLHLTPLPKAEKLPKAEPSTLSSPSAPSSGSTPRSSNTIYKNIPKPPPISISPNLRRFTSQPTHSLSGLLNPDSHSSSAGQQLELAERLDWDIRTGRSDTLTMRLQSTSTSNATLPLSRDGGRDRWGNRWGIENHILSPVISERTEPTHTSIDSPVSTGSLSMASIMYSIPTHDSSNLSRTNSPPLPSNQLVNSQEQAHHQHARNLLNRKKIKNQITNRQRDLNLAHRQIAKRIEKQKRDQMINRRDEIAAQLIQNPADAKLVRDLGKLYLEFHHPTLENKPIESFRRGKNTQTTSRSEPSLKLAIHYLEQSIQLENLDPLTWSYLAKAWSLLLAYPTEHAHEREQRLSNSSLAFRKSIVISSNLPDPNHENLQQTNRFRLSYAQHLESIHKYREAASILQDALELDETDPDGWWALGRMMELWALDNESEVDITKHERVERMKHSCEAYQKAIQLQPEDSTIQQSKLNGEEILEKLKIQVKAEDEAKARELKAREDIILTAQRIRGLNLSPFTNNKISSSTSTTTTTPPPPTTTTIKNTTNSIIQPSIKSSSLALKKLVAELREIPEFGKKVNRPPSSPRDPSSSENNHKVSNKKESILVIDSSVNQVESVVSSSSTTSHAVQKNQTFTSESDVPCSDHFSPSFQTPQETSKNHELDRGLESYYLSPPLPKNSGSDSSQISQISLTPSSNVSPTSTRTHNDVRMTVMSLTTDTSVIDNLNHHQEMKNISDNHHTFHSDSYAPPSPSTLPTSIMQSLSSSKFSACKIPSPRNVSLPNSPTDCLQNEIIHQTSPHLTDSISKPNEPNSKSDESSSKKPDESNSKKQDESKLSSELTHRTTTNESFNFTSLPQTEFQQHQTTADVFKVTQSNSLHHQAQEPRVSYSTSHSPCDHRIAFDVNQQNYTGDLNDCSNGRMESNLPISRVVEDSWNAIGQRDESRPGRSPPPPQIPPRPKSVCIHPTISTISNSIPSSSSVFHNNLWSGSSLGIRLGSSPLLENHIDSFSPSKCINKSPPRPLDSSFPNGSSPGSDVIMKKRTTSLTSPINEPTNERFLTTLNAPNQLDHLSPSSSHRQPHLQQSFPVYDYSLIDSHLKSILEVDMKRKAELKEIKKQIRRTDEWAEHQRRSIVEEIRRICTPVNNASTNGCLNQNDLSSKTNEHTTHRIEFNPNLKNVSVQSDLDFSCRFNKNQNKINHHQFTRSMSTPPENRSSSSATTTINQEITQQLEPKNNQLPNTNNNTYYQPLIHPNNPKPNLNQCEDSDSKSNQIDRSSLLVNNHNAQQFDKLGPAGFAINGITSIIQLLHHPRRGHFT